MFLDNKFKASSKDDAARKDNNLSGSGIGIGIGSTIGGGGSGNMGKVNIININAVVK